MNHSAVVCSLAFLFFHSPEPAKEPGEVSSPRQFYVDSDRGRDTNDGLSVEATWRSLERVNDAELEPGDTVRFKRGGLWRGFLRPQSGTQHAPITYTSFGDGAKPLILGSKSRNRPEDWLELPDNLWATPPMDYHEGERLLSLEHGTWRHHQEAGAKVTLTHERSEGKTVVRVVSTQSGQRANHVQLWGPTVSCEDATHLPLRFRARCSLPFRLPGMEIMLSQRPWTRLASAAAGAAITPEWQDFEAIFQVPAPPIEGRLHLNLGGFLPKDAVFEFQPKSLHVTTPTIADPLDVDVGNIIFDHGNTCGWKKWSIESLEHPGDYYYEPASWQVFLKSPAHPATLYDSIECAMRRHVIQQGNTHHVIYDGLCIKYGASHGFGGGNTHHLVIRNCDLGYIGGAHQFTRPDGVPVRFGNAIEFWGAAADHLIEGCRIWEVYDAALTNQNKTATVTQENIVYRNNVIWNCEYSFEYWNHPNSSATRNIRFINNTCIRAGTVWSHAQRPNPNGSHLMFYSNSAATSGLEVKYNIFYQATDWGSRYTSGWKVLPDMDHNLWFSDTGVMTSWFGKLIESFEDYQTQTGLDRRSLFVDPQFRDAEKGDFRLAPTSPARSMRSDGGPIGAEPSWAADGDSL